MNSQLPVGGVLDGRYLLHQRIGGGRSGAVYRATHISLQKMVAVKLLHDGDRLAPRDFAQFRTEAEALGRLTHPGIVSVIDFGVEPEAGGTPYLVMELVDGVTLASWLAGHGAVDLEDALPWLRLVADALDYAHAQGVRHGDLSAGNVLLTGHGAEATIKIIDFGLARLLEGDVENERSGDETDAADRAGGRIALTPAYAAPERVRGAWLSVGSDVYAFAALVYHVITGRAPFEGEVRSVLEAQLTQVPMPPSRWRPDLPAGADAAVLSGLAKRAEERPHSAGALVQALAVPVRSLARARWRRREAPRRLGLAAALALGLALLGSVVGRSPLLQRAEGFTIDARVALSPAREPDPRLLLVSIDDEALAGDGQALADSGERVAAVLERAMAAGPAVIALDLLLPQTWAVGPRFGNLLLAHADRLVLGMASDGALVVGPEAVDPLVAATLGAEATSRLFGLVSHEPDADGIVRHGRTAVLDQRGTVRPTLAGRAWSLATATAIESADTFGVDYAVDTSHIERFGWRDFERMLASGPWLHRRVVLVGAEYTGSGDRHRMPRPGGLPAEVSGLTLQAAHLDTLLQSRRLRAGGSVPVWSGVGIALFVVALAAVWGPTWLGLLTMIGMALVGMAAAWGAFLYGVVVPLAAPLLMGALTIGLALPVVGRWPAAPE